MPFNRAPFRFDVSGLDLNRRVDVIPPGRYPILQNVDSYRDGELTQRPGLLTGLALVAGQRPAHSIRRLSDPSSGAALLLAGVGTHLASADTGLAAATDRLSGFSGNPLALVPWRPDQSAQSWMYIADSAQMRKASWDGATFRLHTVGIAAPTAPPSAFVQSFAFRTVEAFSNSGVLTGAGLAGGPATLLAATGQRRVDTTATAVVTTHGYTIGVVPAAMTNIVPGTILTDSTAGLTMTVEDTYESGAETTVAGIQYDAGAIGTATVQLKQTSKYMRTGQVVRVSTLTGGGGTVNYAIIENVFDGPEGIRSIRITLADTFAIAAFVTPMASFTADVLSAVTAGDTIRAEGVRVSLSAAGTGTVTHSGLALDLSSFSNFVSFSNYVPQSNGEDYMHLDLRSDRPDRITEIKIMLDLGDSSFTQDYLFTSFRPSDLTPVLEGQQTAIANAQQRLQRRIAAGGGRSGAGGFLSGQNDSGDFGQTGGADLPPPGFTNPGEDGGAVGDELTKGRAQWAGMTLRLSDLEKVGCADKSKTLSSVKAIRVSITATDAVVVDMDSWWIGGGAGPDVAGYGYSVTSTVPGQPYVYRVRLRNSATGAVSNWSPASLAPVYPHRQSVTVLMPTFASSDADKVDVERYGGGLLGWHYVGTIDNGTVSFGDDLSDYGIMASPDEGQGRYQPWRISDKATSGTSAANGVSGIALRDSGANFNPAWAPGTRIIVDGVATAIRQGVSSSLLLLNDSLGARSSVKWEIPEPILQGQPLPVLAGPYHGFFFACGDTKNPGRLYYSNGNDPDSTDESHYIEITAPSEPLQNILVYGNRCFVWSTERAFAIDPAFTLATQGGGLFVANELPGWVGLPHRWAFCTGANSLWYLGRDGIYESDGGGVRNITREALDGWFPYEGIAGGSVNGIPAPDMTPGNAGKFFLSFADGKLLFDYVDTSGANRTLVWRPDKPGWRLYAYGQPIARHYTEEGQNVHGILCGGNDTTTAKLYRVGGTDDAGTAISCHVRTPSFSAEEQRAQKDWADLVVKLNPGSATVTITPGFDEHSATITPTAVTGAGDTESLIDIASGSGRYARNISLDFAWSGGGAILYGWEVAWLARPEDTIKRATDYTPLNYLGPKMMRGVRIQADTGGATKTVLVEYVTEAGAIATKTLSITHSVKHPKPYAFDAPFVAMALRLRPTDSSLWKLYPPEDGDWAFDQLPDLTAKPTDYTDLGSPHAKYLYGFDLTLDTSSATVNFQVQGDGGALLGTFSAAATGKTSLPFVFPTPVITHQIRVFPLAAMRVWPIEQQWWDFDPEPELTTQWGVTQQTSHGSNGFIHFRPWAYLAVRSTASVTFTITADGVVHSFVLASTAGAAAKVRVPLDVIKAKVVTYKIAATDAATPFRLYRRDCEIGIKTFGSEGPFDAVRPFGDDSYTQGPKV